MRLRVSAETRFAASPDHLHVPDHGILHLLRREERFSTGLDETRDTLATLQHDARRADRPSQWHSLAKDPVPHVPVERLLRPDVDLDPE
jgi:hypothetical protein